MSVSKIFIQTLGMSSLLLTASISFAELNSDIALVRSLAPENHDLAQVQIGILEGEDDNEAVKRGAQNYLYQDVNKDGLKDLVAIYEQNPTLKNIETEAPCDKLDYATGCTIAYGPRIINIYVGQKDGSLKLALSKTGYIIAADDGGVYGDPLVGLKINKKQAFSVELYGGSNWRWGYTDTIQYRNGNFYVIGKDSISGWTGDGRFESKSENLLTGLVIEKSAKDAESEIVVKKYHVSVKPLVKFADYKGQLE